MKKTFLLNYFYKIIYSWRGEDYNKILTYFGAELITSLILYFFIAFLDSFFISQVHTTYYAALGVTSPLLHMLTKVGEGFSVGLVILCGQYNGIKDYKQVGKSLATSFWTTFVIGAIISASIYLGSYWICWGSGLPNQIIESGAPFLRLKAVSIFFSFIFFSLVGFLRGIKNTNLPMTIFMFGGLIFIFFDYVLIFGKLGFPQMDLQGSAVASIIQYLAMVTLALYYIFTDIKMRKYEINLFEPLKLSNLSNLITLSCPVILDKASFALCYMWLVNRVSFIVKFAPYETSEKFLASFSVLRQIERLSILPGIAFAQVITFLVSNDFKVNNWQNIKGNIKKVVFLSCLIMFFFLTVLCTYARFFVKLLDKNGVFTDFVVSLIPIISVLLFFDLLQLVLAAALRGTSNVKTVMWTRILVIVMFFFPLSSLFSLMPVESLFVKFICVYSSLYISNIVMIIVYIKKFQSNNQYDQRNQYAQYNQKANLEKNGLEKI